MIHLFYCFPKSWSAYATLRYVIPSYSLPDFGQTMPRDITRWTTTISGSFRNTTQLAGSAHEKVVGKPPRFESMIRWSFICALSNADLAAEVHDKSLGKFVLGVSCTSDLITSPGVINPCTSDFVSSSSWMTKESSKYINHNCTFRRTCACVCHRLESRKC